MTRDRVEKQSFSLIVARCPSPASSYFAMACSYRDHRLRLQVQQYFFPIWIGNAKEKDDDEDEPTLAVCWLLLWYQSWSWWYHQERARQEFWGLYLLRWILGFIAAFKPTTRLKQKMYALSKSVLGFKRSVRYVGFLTTDLHSLVFTYNLLETLAPGAWLCTPAVIINLVKMLL